MQSETIGSLAKALAAAQGEIKTAGKGKENPFFKSHYADLASIREACAGPLSKNGLAYVQTTQFEGDAAWLETTLMHASGEWMRGRYPLKPVKNDPQGMGSAITYAKRYALAALVGVVAVDEDDDGEAASGRPGASVAVTAPDPKKAAATVWANQALEIVAGFKTERDLNIWHKANADTIARVRDQNEAGHKRLVDAIRAKSAQFSPLNA